MSQAAHVNVLVSASSSNAGFSAGASIQQNNTFGNGTTAGNADGGYYGELTIVDSSTPHALDFNAGGLIGLDGNVIAWVDIVGLIIRADAGNTQNIVVGNHANALDFGCGSTGTIYIKPGETKVLVDVTTDPGYTITGGTADTLKLAIASGTNQIYEIWAIGRTA